MYALCVYGLGVEVNDPDDKMKEVLVTEVISTVLTTLPLAIAAFAVNTNFVKPSWIWSATLLSSATLLTYLFAKKVEADEDDFLCLAYFISAFLLTGVGIGLAPPTTKILSTKLRISLVGSIVPIIVAAFVTRWLFFRSDDRKNKGI